MANEAKIVKTKSGHAVIGFVDGATWSLYHADKRDAGNDSTAQLCRVYARGLVARGWTVQGLRL